MKMTYTPNPLDIIVELDEHEQEVFKLKLKVKELEEDLGSASVYLDPKNASWVMNKSPRRPEGHTLESLIQEVRKDYLDMDYMYGEGEQEHTLDKRVDTLFEHYMVELKSGHVGDCTAFPMSCSKCHAEDILGIHTTKGIGKHMGHRIQSAFSRWNPETKEHDRPEVSLAQALEKVRSDSATYEWLLNYRNTHFKEQS